MFDLSRSSFPSASAPLGRSSKGRESYNRFPFRQYLRSKFFALRHLRFEDRLSQLGAVGALLEGRESYNRSAIRQPLRCNFFCIATTFPLPLRFDAVQATLRRAANPTTNRRIVKPFARTFFDAPRRRARAALRSDQAHARKRALADL